MCIHFSPYLLRQMSTQVSSEQGILQKRILQNRPILKERSYPGSREWDLVCCLPDLLFICSWTWFSYMSWSVTDERWRDTTPCPTAASSQRAVQQGCVPKHGSQLPSGTTMKTTEVWSYFLLWTFYGLFIKSKIICSSFATLFKSDFIFYT